MFQVDYKNLSQGSWLKINVSEDQVEFTLHN